MGISERSKRGVKKIGKTANRVRVHFDNTSTETISNKFKRMLKNGIQQTESKPPAKPNLIKIRNRPDCLACSLVCFSNI